MVDTGECRGHRASTRHRHGRAGRPRWGFGQLRVGAFAPRRQQLVLAFDGRPLIDVCALALVRAGCEEIRYECGEIHGRVPGRPGAVVTISVGVPDGLYTPVTVTARRRPGVGRRACDRLLADAVVRELRALVAPVRHT
jgi:hypothetical protein